MKDKGGRPRLSEEEKAKNAALREERKKQELWLNEVAALPDSASPASELDWIRNHPAMGRLDRIENRTSDTRVILEVSDIHPVHGDAPSKAAVSMLQHWCNNPSEFYRNMLTEQRKATKIKDDGSIVDDVENSVEVRNIDALIASIAQAVDDMEITEESL